MIKDCKVLINNKLLTVIVYDGVEVQIPAIGRKADTVKVIKRDNGYFVVDDNYKEEVERPAHAEEVKLVDTGDEQPQKPKKRAKKTTKKSETGEEKVSENNE